MLIYDERTQPIMIDSIHNPIPSSHLWVLDLEMMDFTLAPISILEEVHCPTFVVNILGFHFTLPVNWYVVVYDVDTTQVDAVKVSELAGQSHTLLGSGPDLFRASPVTATIEEYIPKFRNVSPTVNKHQMICHPIAPGYWINVSPVDTYNKYLKDKIVGDLF